MSMARASKAPLNKGGWGDLLVTLCGGVGYGRKAFQLVPTTFSKSNHRSKSLLSPEASPDFVNLLRGETVSINPTCPTCDPRRLTNNLRLCRN